MIEEKFVKSSGNIFRDIGVDKPVNAHLKSQLIQSIRNILQNKLHEQNLADQLELHYSQLMLLVNHAYPYKFFSIKELCKILDCLGYDINITVNKYNEE